MTSRRQLKLHLDSYIFLLAMASPVCHALLPLSPSSSSSSFSPSQLCVNSRDVFLSINYASGALRLSSTSTSLGELSRGLALRQKSKRRRRREEEEEGGRLVSVGYALVSSNAPQRPRIQSRAAVTDAGSQSVGGILQMRDEAMLLPPIGQHKRVVLVRHGESTWNAIGRIQGSSDFAVLTTKGETQAETSRQMLLSDNFDGCFYRCVIPNSTLRNK